MRRILLPALTLLLLSCSVSDLLPVPTSPPPAPTLEAASTVTPTASPTQATPTFTHTPTFEGGMPQMTAAEITGTVTPLIFETPLSIFDTAVPTSSFPTVTPDIPGEGFQSVSISGSEIFWGVCEPGTVDVVAVVSDPQEVSSVLFFLQLQETTSDDSTPWSNGEDMKNEGGGLFTYTLNADTINGRRNYLEAWVLYQLVATDQAGKVIGRTKVYEGKLKIRPCP